MLDRWAPWYDTLPEGGIQYADGRTYEIVAKFLGGLDVEDWGCGLAAYREFHGGGYKGVDGTLTEYCDVQADLTEYRSTTPALLLRHVLEHNLGWRRVLDNAIASFTKRMVIVLFTPPQDATRILAADVGGLGVPDIGFLTSDLTNPIMDSGAEVHLDMQPAHCGYDNVETLIYCERT